MNYLEIVEKQRKLDKGLKRKKQKQKEKVVVVLVKMIVDYYKEIRHQRRSPLNNLPKQMLF